MRQRQMEVIERYGIRYVVLGPRERGKYGVESLDHLTPALLQAFTQEDVQIYAVPDPDA